MNRMDIAVGNDHVCVMGDYITEYSDCSVHVECVSLSDNHVRSVTVSSLGISASFFEIADLMQIPIPASTAYWAKIISTISVSGNQALLEFASPGGTIAFSLTIEEGKVIQYVRTALVLLFSSLPHRRVFIQRTPFQTQVLALFLTSSPGSFSADLSSLLAPLMLILLLVMI